MPAKLQPVYKTLIVLLITSTMAWTGDLYAVELAVLVKGAGGEGWPLKGANVCVLSVDPAALHAETTTDGRAHFLDLPSGTV